MIDPIILGYCSLVVMLALAFLGVPFGYAMTAVGTIGLLIVDGLDMAASQNIMLAWEQGSSLTLMTIPLFVFMGTLAANTGIVSNLFDCVSKWIGHVPGGLCMSGIVAGAAFGAVTGSTGAACATMGRIVVPELQRYRYNDGLSTGAMSAAATLAAIIPPSVLLIIYALLTEQSVGVLFIATIGPGIAVTILFTLYVWIRCKFKPELGPAGPRYGWGERFRSLKWALPVIFVFCSVLGTMFMGIATPTEAAALGVVGVAIIAIFMRRLSFAAFKASFHEGVMLSTTIFFLMIGGYLLSRLLVCTGTTDHMIAKFLSFNLSYYSLIFVITVLFIFLGCVMDVMGCVVLTMPTLFPICMNYGVDPNWLGVYVVLLLILGGLTPPVGMMVFILHSVTPDVPVLETFKGAAPFMLILILSLIICVAFPELVLWLPSQM